MRETIERVLAGIGTVILFPLRLLIGVVLWMLGLDLRPSTRGDADGQGIATFFAGLITTQAGALIILVQGKSGKFVLTHLLIYLAFALMPIIGIVWILLRGSTISVAQRSHAFDDRTVWFSRWTLFYSLALGFGLPLLGLFDLIPGQVKQGPYTSPEIACLAPQQVFASLVDHRNEQVNQLVRLNAAGFARDSQKGQKVLVIEQFGSFEEDYQSFTAWVSFGAEVIVTNGQALLVRDGGNDSSSAADVIVLPLLPDEPDAATRQCFEIPKPRKGDFLVLILVVEPKNKTDDLSKFIPTDYRVSLRRASK